MNAYENRYKGLLITANVEQQQLHISDMGHIIHTCTTYKEAKKWIDERDSVINDRMAQRHEGMMWRDVEGMIVRVANHEAEHMRRYVQSTIKAEIEKHQFKVPEGVKIVSTAAIEDATQEELCHTKAFLKECLKLMTTEQIYAAQKATK